MTGGGKIWRGFRIALLIVGVLLSWTAAGQEEVKNIRIGVLTKGNLHLTEQRWPATAAYLSNKLPGHHFEIVPLDFDEIEPAVRTRQIDFLLTNPASYVELESRYRLNSLLTLQRRLNGRRVSLFAGVIIVRADRNDIQHLTDLRGKHFAAVDKNSFGGWVMAWRQMEHAGLNPLKDLARIDFTGSHEDVVRAVMSGAEDAGTVRTGVLEQMVASGELHPGDFRILPEEPAQLHQPDEFPLQHSTSYYPEWPLARLPHVSDELARQVTEVLLAMPEDSEAARSAAIAGWIPALSYTPIHDLMKELRLAQYQHYGQISLMDVLRQYGLWLLALLSLISLLSLLVIYVLHLNRGNRRINKELQHELGEKAAAQREILAQKERLTNVLESIAEGYFAVDRDWRITSINSHASEVINRGRHHLTGSDLWAALPELATIAYSSFSRSFEQDLPIEFTAYYSGSDQWLEFHTYPSGAEMGIYFHDVSARINATERLEEREQQLRAILENMLDGVITIDNHGTIQSFNKMAQTIFGYSSSEVKGRDLDLLMPPAHSGRHVNFIGRYLAGAPPKVIGIGQEVQGRRKSGELFPMDITVSEIVTNGEHLFVGICRDISQRKQDEARVIQLATAMDHLAEGVFISDAEGQITYVNPAYATMLGVSPASLSGHKAAIFELAQQDRERYGEFHQALYHDFRPWSGHYTVQCSNGLHFIEESTIAPVGGKGDKVHFYVAVCRDITHQLRDEQRQRQADRIEATATMAIGITQEFETLLTAIIEQSNSAATEMEPHTVASNNITQVLRAANRARILGRQLLDFSHQEYQQPQLLHPRDLVKGAVVLLQSVLPSAISIKQHLNNIQGDLWIAPGQFQQVVMSLMLKIIKTMDDNPGAVEVTLGERLLGRDDEEVSAGLGAGNYAALELSENSNRPQHGGDSEEDAVLELIKVHEIIRRNGGALYLESRAGGGSTFRIYLPLVRSQNTTAQVDAAG